MIEGKSRNSTTWQQQISLPALLVDRGTGPLRDLLAWRLIDGTTDVRAELTFGALYHRSCWMAHKFQAGGIGQGDVVVLLTESRLEFLYAEYA